MTLHCYSSLNLTALLTSLLSFVLSIDETAVNNKSPVFLRSYTNTQQPSLLPNIKIWEAGRATSAAPTYFGPMQVGDQKLIDGGLGANNPVGWWVHLSFYGTTFFNAERLLFRLWNEVLSVYGAGRPISCFLSIGTGIPKNRALGGIFKLPTSLAANATNSEIMHILFRTLLDAYAPQTMRAKYWRLNVGHEIPGWPEDPKAAKKNDLPELDDIKGIYGFVEKTEQYITQQADLIRRCVETIQESRWDIPLRPSIRKYNLIGSPTQGLAIRKLLFFPRIRCLAFDICPKDILSAMSCGFS